MNEYEVTDPRTGITVLLYGDSPPTEEDLNAVFSELSPPPKSPYPDVSIETPTEDQVNQSMWEEALLEGYGPMDLKGVVDAGASIASSGAAEIPAGWSGIVSAPFLGVDGAVEVMDSVRDIISFGPFSDEGKQKLKRFQELANSTGFPQWMEAQGEKLGDAGARTAEQLGGDVPQQAGASAAMQSIPTYVLSLMGLAGVMKLRGAKKVTGIPDEVVQKLEAEGKDVDMLSDGEIKQIQSQTIEILNDQQKRAEAFREMGIEPTRAQVTRDVTDFQTQEEIAKGTSRTRAALDAQSQRLNDNVTDLRNRTGGRLDSDSGVYNTVLDRSTKLDEQISSLYKEARQAAPDAKNVRFNALSQTMRKLRGDELKVVSALRTRLGDMGIIDPKTYKPTGKISVSQAEEVRKFLNEMYSSDNAYAIRQLKASLDDDVFSVAGNDVFKKARQAKAEFEAGLDKAKISKFDNNKKNLVRDILENKVDPEALTDKVVFQKGYRADDLRQLKNYLNQDDLGKQAWDDLRAETLEKIRENSFKGADDDLTLSAAALDSTLKRVGKGKMEVLFTPEERIFLSRLQEVAEYRRPKRRTATGRGPSSQAVESLMKRYMKLKDKGSIISDILADLEIQRLDRRAASGEVQDSLTITIRPSAAAAGVTAPVALSEQMKRSQQ